MTPVRSSEPVGAVLPVPPPGFPVLDRLAEALRRRHIRHSYGKLPDARLRDIGLTPFDVVQALSLPLSQSADEALARAAAEEAAKW